MKDTWIIYSHRNMINNKAYIGQTKNINDRWIPSHYRNCRYFERAINKYGWENFEHIILKDNIETVDEANYWEEFYIKLFNTMDETCGYNLTSGGKNKNVSEETKALIKKNHADFSKEKHPQWGKHLSEKTKRKISQSHKGLKLSDEAKKKLKSRKGADNNNSKPVMCCETGELFACAKDASQLYKVDNSTLSKAAKNNGICKQLHWRYLTKEEYEIGINNPKSLDKYRIEKRRELT